jgi:hypothetical protein
VKGGFSVTTPVFDKLQVQSRVVLRQVNDRILEVVTAFGAEQEGSFLCECGRGDCLGLVELSVDEYEAIRLDDDRLVLATGH